MKCPKCDYLGFETGDRCKNCGYDFSLIESSEPEEIEVDLTMLAADDGPAGPSWLDQVDRGLGQRDIVEPYTAPKPEPVVRKPQAVAAPAARLYETPLFAPSDDDAGDEPLIRLPATPRPPLAVRRTPETPRLRAVPKLQPRITPEPELDFVNEPAAIEDPPVTPRPSQEVATGEVSEPSVRLAAAAVDHVLLLAIDLVVVYFTLRMAGLSTADWRTLPLAPLLTFLLLLKLAYFCAFTAVGGQTIGKMAMRIRVVTEAGYSVDGARALKRTLAGAISTVALGLGFVPALIGSDRRTLHDRVAQTRVITLRSL